MLVLQCSPEELNLPLYQSLCEIKSKLSLKTANSTSTGRNCKNPWTETWRKHATPCFRYVYVKVVRFRCIRSNGNARKRHETGNGNTGYPSCFRNGLTCFCHVSVYGFLQFRPVKDYELLEKRVQYSFLPRPRMSKLLL